MGTMFCPNCAKAATTEQKFCRSCGFNLERTADSLLEQLSGDPALGLRKNEQALEKLGAIAFTGFGIVIAIGIIALIYTVLTRMVLSGAQPIFGAFLAVFLVFAGLSLAYVFWHESLKDEPSALRSAPQSLHDDSVTLRQLGDAAAFEPAQSVVETTTELLSTENTARRFSDRRDDDTF